MLQIYNYIKKYIEDTYLINDTNFKGLCHYENMYDRRLKIKYIIISVLLIIILIFI